MAVMQMLCAETATNFYSKDGTLSSPTRCQRADGTSPPCGAGNDLCHAAGYPSSSSPQYHIRDYSCGMNDPAAVVYDPVHAVYHDHWEDHLAIPGGQYVRGHAVSRDLVHWARMPVSLWNDRTCVYFIHLILFLRVTRGHCRNCHRAS